MNTIYRFFLFLLRNRANASEKQGIMNYKKLQIKNN